MPADKRVIPQDRVDPIDSLLVDAHSLKALPFTQDYSSTLRFSESRNPNKLYDQLDQGLALASLIQNIVLYDTLIVDSLILQTEPEVKEAFSLFPGIIKGVYLETKLRREIGERVYTVVPIWDRAKRPRSISDELWNHILLVEGGAKSLVDKMTKVVPNLIPPEFELDERRKREVMRLEIDAEKGSSNYENLPDCCVSSSTCLARTHYYLELARELSLPLSVHPIRSSYLEILVAEYKQEHEDFSAQQEKGSARSSCDSGLKDRVDRFWMLQDRISEHLSQSGEPNDEWIAELHRINEELQRFTAREQIVSCAENIIAKDAADAAIESGAPISLQLNIPPIAELVMSYAVTKKCPIHEAIIEVRNSKNATKFREWCQIFTKAGMNGRPGLKEQIELHNEFVDVCKVWKNDVKEEVIYKTRSITLEKIPIVGGALKSLNMDKLSIRDPVLAPKKNVTYFLLLNDLYHYRPKNLY